jgi:DNA-binding MarR family transcriptional regulator
MNASEEVVTKGRSRAVATSEGAAREGEASAVRGHLELRLWLRLLACASKIEGILQRRLRKEFETSLARFDVLAQLERFPDGLTMSDLSRRLMVSNGAITGLADKLMSEGMVERQGDPADRRAVIVRLTPEGRANFLRMARRHEEWVVSILGELSETAQSELLQNLTLLKRNLDLQFGERPGAKVLRQGDDS